MKQIIIDGDEVEFVAVFTPAIVSVKKGKIEGTGAATFGGKKVCIEGDESKVEVKGCDYIAGAFSIPGKGNLKIKKLAGNQLAKKTNSAGKAVILKGLFFTAEFQVQSPAKQPNPSGSPVPDPTPTYTGMGGFVNSNKKFNGS